MSVIMFNALLQIDDEDLFGLHRVVADIRPGQIILAQLPIKGLDGSPESGIKIRCVDRVLLEDLERNDKLRAVELRLPARFLVSDDQLTPAERSKFDRRRAAMSGFLDHGNLCAAFTSPRGFGSLVKRATRSGNYARSAIYTLRDLLFEFGIEEGSLHPRFSQCGAPSKPRPCDKRKKAGRKTTGERLGIVDEFPQQGVTEAMRTKIMSAYLRMPNPKPTLKKLHEEIVEHVFVSQYIITPKGDRKPVMPPRGTFPSIRQIRHMIQVGTRTIDRILAKTTAGHFNRNHRGMTGFAWQGFSGPGHCFAIDSTMGDIFLRSSINRAWIIGRPIVYIVVCPWSTAVVGFYVCLTGPSWSTARVALFSTFVDQALMGELWGYEPILVLNPAPTCPSEFLCDRGEYLSAGATETGRKLGLDMSYNPSYRPDLKGLVEVLHRIAKDEQFYFLPGAIDARRRELELRTDVRESTYTLRQYVQYLHGIFAQYNLFADRGHRLTAPMIAAGVDPTPAGLWAFGHDIGIGYRKSLSLPRLCDALLPTKDATVNRKGIYLGQLLYESPLAAQEQWTTVARSYGARNIVTQTYPGSTSTIWWQDPMAGGHHRFKLSEHARAPSDICFDEWLDAYAHNAAKKSQRDYERLSSAIALSIKIGDMTRKAQELNAQAEADARGERPTLREARSMEASMGTDTSMPQQDAPPPPPSERSYDQVYDDAMRVALNSSFAGV